MILHPHSGLPLYLSRLMAISSQADLLVRCWGDDSPDAKRGVEKAIANLKMAFWLLEQDGEAADESLQELLELADSVVTTGTTNGDHEGVGEVQCQEP